MNQQAAGQFGTAAPNVFMDSAVISVKEFLASRLGYEEYGMDILRVQDIRSFL